MHNQETAELLKTLKKLLHEKKFSYTKLTTPLGLSLSSVKRLMSSDDISYGRLLAICNLIGLDLQEVLQLHASQSDGLFKFTEKQEKIFAKSPHYLAYLYELAADLEPFQIEKKWNISKQSTKNYLHMLESLDLIQVSESRVTRKFKGIFAWDDRGTLGLAFSKQQVLSFSEHVMSQLTLSNSIFLDFSTWTLSDKNYSDLQSDLKSLSKKYRQLSKFNRKTLPKEQIQRYTFVGMADSWYQAPYRKVIEI